jgi:hypothetical protein
MMTFLSRPNLIIAHYCLLCGCDYSTMSSPKDVYLIAYNSFCCLGWTAVWALSVTAVRVALAEGQLPSEALASVYAYENVSVLLYYSQMAALLEIVHALLRLVRSPVLVTAMQVGSRIVALLALVYSSEAQSKCSKLL